MTKDEAPARSALKLALEGAANYIDALGGDSRKYRQALAEQPAQHQCKFPMCQNEEYQQVLAEQIKRELYTGEPAQPQQEPVAWISVKDALPKAVRGVSYNASLTDVVLVRHSDRPDYPITAHAVVGEGLGAGIAIPTEGASEHPEIAWYSASSNLNNPFDLKNDDYGRYLPKVFGSKITHWKPIDTSPPAQREWVGLTDEEKNKVAWSCGAMSADWLEFTEAVEAKLKEKNSD